MTRIIAGVRGGHRLKVPAGERTRPTTDRVREAVFAALISWGGDESAAAPLQGVSFLDCFAGSGAVGLEAASRGAGPVVAVEADGATAGLIRANAASTKLPIDVRHAKVETLLAQPAGRGFDVMWFDPPYALDTDKLMTTIRSALAQGWLMDDGMVIVERSTRAVPMDLSLCFTTTWQRHYGDTTVYFGMGGVTCR